jgi:hypothetical protein
MIEAFVGMLINKANVTQAEVNVSNQPKHSYFLIIYIFVV